MSECKSCGAEILWVETEKGKQMPLDAKPSPDGRFRKERVEHDAAMKRDRKIVHFVRDDELEENTRKLYTSHFATCPDADEHRVSD